MEPLHKSTVTFAFKPFFACL